MILDTAVICYNIVCKEMASLIEDCEFKRKAYNSLDLQN